MLFQLHKERIIKHSIIWTIITIYFFLVDSFKGKVEANIAGISIIVFSYVFTYYFLSLFILNKYRTQPIKLLIGVLFCLVIFCSLMLSANYIIVPFLGGHSNMSKKPLWGSILNLIIAFFIDVMAAYAFFNHNLNIQRLKSQFEKEKLFILKDLIFLRNQFHSKFTFDFINYCYTKVDHSSNAAAQAINLFSKLLEYSMAVRQNEQVELQREITFIQDYIALQKILSTNLHIELNCKGTLNERYITSRILITFVENALKHGVMNDSSNPILININVECSIINFSVQNKKNANNKSMKTGIGQQNAKQYLELFYPKKYQLAIKDSFDTYICSLTLSE